VVSLVFVEVSWELRKKAEVELVLILDEGEPRGMKTRKEMGEVKPNRAGSGARRNMMAPTPKGEG